MHNFDILIISTPEVMEVGVIFDMRSNALAKSNSRCMTNKIVALEVVADGYT